MTPIAQRAVDEWNREVDTEMIRLIERGMPPHRAATRAQQIVEARRSGSAEARDNDAFRKAIASVGY